MESEHEAVRKINEILKRIEEEVLPEFNAYSTAQNIPVGVRNNLSTGGRSLERFIRDIRNQLKSILKNEALIRSILGD